MQLRPVKIGGRNDALRHHDDMPQAVHVFAAIICSSALVVSGFMRSSTGDSVGWGLSIPEAAVAGRTMAENMITQPGETREARKSCEQALES